MSNSVFTVTEPDSSDCLTLVVAPDGTVTPDKDTVKTYLSSRQTVDINLMTMKKVEAGKVNVTLDSLTYINSEEAEDPEEMDEISRNLLNFRMDHDYTPHTSPPHQMQAPHVLPLVEDDELAHTLSMLEEGGILPTPTPPPLQTVAGHHIRPEPLTKITKIVKGKRQTIFVNSKQKAKMISTGLLKEKPSTEVAMFKKPKPVVKPKVVKAPSPPPPVAEEKMEEEEEEDEEDLFESDDDEDDANDSDFELEEELRFRSGGTRKMRSRKSSSSISKPENQKKKLKVKEVVTPEPPPVEVKVAEKKPPVKKEKKVPKPPPVDDFALFSTPDIIRRVGKDKEISPPKPAKISPENRSKSALQKTPEKSPVVPDKRRLSLEVKKQDRRLSNDRKVEEQVSVQEFDTLSNSNESIPDDQLEPLPSAEDIRAIIQNENTKSFTMSHVMAEPLPDAPMNLEAGLELDQSILDINDELSEDILYQVAQSLVDNTELQNVIDKSIVDGNLVLDPALQQSITGAVPPPPDQLVPIETVNNGLQAMPHEEDVKGTQIVRPDGRVVVIPPIERPTTRSRKRRESGPPAAAPAVSPVSSRQPKPIHKPLDDEHVSGNELDSSEEEDEDESEDDPNKLWCICNQPHNNRFMICCDTCEEWYHGKCVNVTKAMGHLMEQEGKEWICVYCKDKSLKRPKAAARRIRKASRTSTDSGGGSGKKASNSASSSTSNLSQSSDDKKSLPVTTGCVVCGKPSRNSSIYCSDGCILKHAQGVEKVVVFDRKSGRLLSGSNAPSAANLDKWLAENPTYEVVRSTNKPVTSKVNPKPANLMQSKLKLVKNAGNDGVSLAIQKRGVNIGVLQHSPKEASASPSSGHNPKKRHSTGNIPSVKTPSKPPGHSHKQRPHPASPITQRPTLTSTPAKKLVQTKIVPTSSTPPPSSKQPMPQKTPKARQAEVCAQPKQENLRETVRKTFFEQLSNRLKKCEELKLSDDELKGISNEIESQLYKCFGDTGQKYKNKYRSLIFNIKDAKNQTLWRRICEKAVNPYQLVRLSPDDLASQELALWREREAKHQLDMIKKSELELLNCTHKFVFKTHKGEQVMEDDRPKDQVTEVISGLGADSTSLEKEEDKDAKDKKGLKHKRDRSRDRRREKDRRDKRSTSKDRRKRSKSHDRSHRKRSRSHEKERHRRSSHKSSRYKKDEKTISTERLDKKSKEILEQLVDKHIVPPLEDKLWKHVPQEDLIPNPTVESDSDHEPSSTVTIPTPPRSSEPDEATVKKIKEPDTSPELDETDDGAKSPVIKPLSEAIWNGVISMIDVAQISITAHEVSGDCHGLGEELPSTLDIVGRISPETVWDYIGKMKSSNSKTISVIRLVAVNMEERMPYLALYSYLSSRNRLGVVKSVTKAVKDFYILPLAGHTPIPDPLLPLSGPGFEDSRPALLLGVLVRDKRKRSSDHGPPGSHTHTKRVRVDIVSPAVPASSTPPSSSRSYTPPPNRDPRVKMSAVPLPVPPPSVPEEEIEDDMDEPYSPEDSDPDTMPEPTNSRLNADDISNLLTGSVKASSFLESGLSTQTFEPFSNKFDSIPGLDDTPTSLPSNSLELQRKMAELDQRIAAQKAEIDKVSQDLVSSAATSDIGSSTLANIALPSDLQQILESIKTIGSKTDSIDSQGENSNSSAPSGTSDLTIPLLLPKLSSRPLIGAASKDVTIPLNLPKTRSKAEQPEKSGGVLSSLSEEDLIKKAEEMLAESEPAAVKRTKGDGFYGTPPKKQRPGNGGIPGLSDD